MATRGSSKAACFLAHARLEIQKRTASCYHHYIKSLSISKPLDQGISRVSQYNSTKLSNSTVQPGLGLDSVLGVSNFKNLPLGSPAVTLKFLGKAREIGSGSWYAGRSILTRSELKLGHRLVQDQGFQRLNAQCRIQNRLLSLPFRSMQEFSSLRYRGDIQIRRTYYVDKQGIRHFKRRGPSSWSEKLASQRSVGALFVLGGVGIVFYYSNQQIVPYTHRKHLMLVSPKFERSIGDHTFEMIMKEYKGRILPRNHPESIRVHKIANQVIEALLTEVKTSDWGQLEKGEEVPMDLSKEWDKDLHEKKLEQSPMESYGVHKHAQDELLDDNWVQKSRTDGLRSGHEGYTKHLEGMKWRIVVVDDNIVNAICIPGGKIVVFTGLLKKFHADSEVATVVAHEIGHAVARHSAESLTNNLFIVAAQLLVLSVVYLPGLVNSISELLLRLPFSRRMEIEADHIGLLLMAAAGYDPRVAPELYEKLGKLDNAPEYAQYMSTHPSGKKRGELLRHTTTMDEAMRVYQQKMSGHGTEGFF